MEEGKWLWKTQSSFQKSPADTASSSSMSSQSDNCVQEQEFAKQSPEHIIESPEVQSKETFDDSLLKSFAEADQASFPESFTEVASNAKEDIQSVRLLKEKLSAALVNVSLKDELVKQHAKVAEEAVAGWEKAEDEAASVKQQLDMALQQNSALEARVGHVDEALKQCVRQLRLAKEEYECKITEALTEKNREYEVIKSKLEILERENQTLQTELISQSEELEIRTTERDLSTKAAETASKQHLESIKMVAKLESECRKLKALSCNKPTLNDKGQNHKSPLTPSYSTDSVTNSQSDTSETSDSWATALMAELHQFKRERSLGKSLPSSSIKIDLMDDFLEMERLAAIQENGHPQEDHHAKLESPKHLTESLESQLREELKEITFRAGELEEKVRKLEGEKAELEMASAQTQMCLENVQVELIENKMKLDELEAELQEASEVKMEFELYANDLKLEAQAMMSKIEFLQAEVDRQRVSSEKLSARCQELEYDLHRKNEELEIQRDAPSRSELEEKEKTLDELQVKIKESAIKLEKQSSECRKELDEKERALSESQKCVGELQIQVKEDEMKLDQQNAAYNSEKDVALAQSQMLLDELQTQLKEATMKLQMELDEAIESKQHLSSELARAREEVGSMSAQIDSLRAQIEKEQAISAELSAKCEEPKREVKQKEQLLDLHEDEAAYIEQRINQEDIASAAGKLAECQKTIASLGNQLKSLATLEDFLIDTASIPRFTRSASLISKAGGGSETWRLHSNNVYLPQKKCDDHLQDPQEGIHTFSKYIEGDMMESSTCAMFKSSSSNRNGYEKLFPMRRS